MLRFFCALLAAAQLTVGADFVKQLNPKDLTPFKPKLPQVVTVTGTFVLTCAIRLKEIHAENGNRIDPIALPSPPIKLDEAMKHAASIPACPSGNR